jgi:hypothetical protein
MSMASTRQDVMSIFLNYTVTFMLKNLFLVRYDCFLCFYNYILALCIERIVFRGSIIRPIDCYSNVQLPDSTTVS